MEGHKSHTNVKIAIMAVLKIHTQLEIGYILLRGSLDILSQYFQKPCNTSSIHSRFPNKLKLNSSGLSTLLLSPLYSTPIASTLYSSRISTPFLLPAPCTPLASPLPSTPLHPSPLYTPPLSSVPYTSIIYPFHLSRLCTSLLSSPFISPLLSPFSSPLPLPVLLRMV